MYTGRCSRSAGTFVIPCGGIRLTSQMASRIRCLHLRSLRPSLKSPGEGNALGNIRLSPIPNGRGQRFTAFTPVGRAFPRKLSKFLPKLVVFPGDALAAYLNTCPAH